MFNELAVHSDWTSSFWVVTCSESNMGQCPHYSRQHLVWRPVLLRPTVKVDRELCWFKGLHSSQIELQYQVEALAFTENDGQLIICVWVGQDDFSWARCFLVSNCAAFVYCRLQYEGRVISGVQWPEQQAEDSFWATPVLSEPLTSRTVGKQRNQTRI